MNSDKTEPNYSKPLACRGVRGAITVPTNNADAILESTRELLKTILLYNDMKSEDIATIYFSTTTDLNAIFPAVAARQIGLMDVALLCGHEMDVPGSLPLCIRVMIHWNTTKTQKEMVHVYLREAIKLRPDRKNLPDLKPKQIDPMAAMVKVLESTHS